MSSTIVAVPRASRGSIGTPVQLFSTFFPINTNNVTDVVFQYEITDFKRQTRRASQRTQAPPEPYRREIVNELLNVQYAYDGDRLLITASRLDDIIEGEVHTKAVKISDNNIFDVSLVFKQVVHIRTLFSASQEGMTDSDRSFMLQLLNIMMIQSVWQSRDHQLTRKGIIKVGSGIPLGLGVVGVEGCRTIATLTEGGLRMGISLTFGGFQEDGPLETCVRNIVGHGPPWNVRDIQQANRRLKGLTIKIRGPLERKKKLATIMTENALTYSFKNEHKTRTVQQYFLERYNVRLARPELNLVRFGMDTAIPMELCHIEPGQFARGRLNAEQTRRMLDLAKKAPSAYQNLIKAAQRGMFSSVPFNLATENEPVSVNGMRLISPDIQFKDGHTINDKEKESASWNIRDRRVIHGLSLKIWMLVNVGERHHERISGFIEEFGSAMEKNGLMGMKRPIDVEHINPHQLDDFIVRFPNQAGLQMVIWLLDSEDSQMYAKIKRFCDVKLGSPSQCMQKAKIFRGNKVDPSYLGNIALKINLKLGGNNWSLLRNQVPILASAPTMIVGADVSHPSAMERAFGQPSIAAVVASMSWRGDFATSLRLLPHRPGSRAVMDIITNLHEMMMEQFCRFRDLVGCAPRKVIFFRDGIDAGAFQYARDIELAAVRSAFFEVFEGQTGDITFLILNKRHQARFFPARSQDAINGKPGANVKPGTYVDSNVTIPGNLGFDFYLISHASPLGTARPVHYHVLEDDSHFSADELIDLGNKLAYNYQRATKGVKLPAPVYLAHLACKRATCYFDNATEGSEAASSSSDPTELYNRFSQNFRIPPEHLLRVPFYA